MKHKQIVTSPLRYPGSKQKFCKTLQNILNSNQIKPELFIEPFAGGASTSLFMLQHNLVDKIALIEKDPLVASFWKTVFFDSSWFIQEVEKIEVTLEKWHFYKNYKPRSIRNQALKCLFLNRTNFSGILKAGPIGGQKQLSKYKIDCRFNKTTLIQKIEILSSYHDRVLFVEEGDYKTVINNQQKKLPSNSFFYFDPPYVNKAKNLYNFYFYEQDHLLLKDFIQNLPFNWLLSYDYEPPIHKLYNSFSNNGFFDITYTTTAKKERPLKKEFLASNLSLSCLNN
jgi:DNA adenine methylase